MKDSQSRVDAPLGPSCLLHNSKHTIIIFTTYLFLSLPVSNLNLTKNIKSIKPTPSNCAVFQLHNSWNSLVVETDSIHIRTRTRTQPKATMAQYYSQQQQPSYGSQASPQNLQFYPSSYTVSGHTTPSQASYGGYGGQTAQAYPTAAGSGAGGYGGAAAGFGGGPAGPSVSGRMGEQGGLRTGWLAAFGTEGYDGEPPLLEELGVNFGHIQTKVCPLSYTSMQH